MFIVDSYINQLNENASKPIGNIDSRSLLLECGFYNDMILNENTFTDRVKELFAKFKKIMKELGRKIVTAVKTMINKVKSIFIKKSIETKKKIEEVQKENNKTEDKKDDPTNQKNPDNEKDDPTNQKNPDNEKDKDYEVILDSKYKMINTTFLPNQNEMVNDILSLTTELSDLADDEVLSLERIKKSIEELNTDDVIINNLAFAFEEYIGQDFKFDLYYVKTVEEIKKYIHLSYINPQIEIKITSKQKIEQQLQNFNNYLSHATNDINEFKKLLDSVDNLTSITEKKFDECFNNIQNCINKRINEIKDQNKQQEYLQASQLLLNELTSYKSKIPQMASGCLQICNLLFDLSNNYINQTCKNVKTIKDYLASHK